MGITLIALLTKFTSLSNNPREIFIFRSGLFIDFINFVGNIIIFLINIIFFLTLYYNYKGINIDKNNKNREKISILKIVAKFMIILIIVQIEATEFSLNNENLFSSKVFTNTTSIAHRGVALVAPENTLIELDRACKIGAKYAEIDIQETKDCELVLTYDEIKTYDASEYFEGEYKNIKI